MIVLDASLLIAHLNAHDVCHDRAGEMLLAAAAHPFAVSTITLAEIFVGPARTGQLDDTRAALRDLEVEEVPVLPGAAEELANLRAVTGLKLPDCCVLLAADTVRARAVLTCDERLGKRADQLGYGWTDGAS